MKWNTASYLMHSQFQKRSSVKIILLQPAIPLYDWPNPSQQPDSAPVFRACSIQLDPGVTVSASGGFTSIQETHGETVRLHQAVRHVLLVILLDQVELALPGDLVYVHGMIRRRVDVHPINPVTVEDRIVGPGSVDTDRVGS